ncbi:putative Ig domain-containing protein [Blastopirellula sp. JC732]|uniref:Ig domain-containing protein n=1 Tax=Blastopirellula sediminis TaxID=2894196 RepID=A0A9X1MHR4_9BACT|nr:putative Ig domain-containing protein [Blastopirellula sediminis]MCC9608216.1 putative Ig domain-containing protein [Blastopirellula sediminis]MCC9626991.1 putative Ig domain-containing protein [Blastopirellula sediminis]
MSKREKVLVGVVGMLVVLGVLYFGYSRYASAYDQRAKQLESLKQQIDREEFTEIQAIFAAQRLAIYQEHCLPEDYRTAQSVYSNWLHEKVGEAGFEDVVIKPLSGKKVGMHAEYAFSIRAKAPLARVTQFCYEFYSFDVLHKIKSIVLRPMQDSEDLEVALTVEAVGIKQVADVVDPKKQRHESLSHGKLADYQKAILARDFFRPGNKPPKLVSTTKHTAEMGKTFSYSVKAEDPDKKDKLSFQLGEGAPEGLQLSERGTLSWKPGALGEFKFNVMVHDDRQPTVMDTKEFTIAVIEPKPPETKPESKPSFDDAQHAFLTATIISGEQPEAWVSLRTKNKMLRLKPGETFEIGQLKGKIVSVGDKNVEIEIGGETVQLRIGQPLSEARGSGDL